MCLCVVIPVYNRECGPALTLESLKRQTLPSFSVVVADDGSSDDSRTRLGFVSSADARSLGKFQLDRIIDAGIASDPLVDETEGYTDAYL
jgi:hypothetical protein